MEGTTINSTGGWAAGDMSLADITLQSIRGPTAFQPLSQQIITPGYTMSEDNPADQYILEKETSVPLGQEGMKIQKDLNMLIPESEKMITSGLHQAKHTLAITSELKLLLENEKKILDHVSKRCDIFKRLKEENKQTTEKWHSEHHKRVPMFEDFLAKLINYSDDQNLADERILSRVQQKVLFEIVSKTAAVANKISVQLAMENTIITDVDLSLIDLKKRIMVMIRQVTSWLNMLKTMDQSQTSVVGRWNDIKRRFKEVKEKAKSVDESRAGKGGASGPQMLTLFRDYEDRIQKLEAAVGRLRDSFSTECPSECPAGLGYDTFDTTFRCN